MKMFLIFILAAGSLPFLVTEAKAETCYYKSEVVSGMNKICYYSCISGTAAITIGSVQLCPLTINR